MIKSVNIKNYILIDEIALDFSKGFNVITGETGAGKSIIIGAIDAALGAKSNKECIKTGADRAVIELTIELENDFDKSILLENGIEIWGNEIVITREIQPSFSRFRINGVMVTQDFIKDIREKFLDIHTQHQSYNYLQTKNHIFLLDEFALKPHRDNIAQFKDKFYTLQQLKKKREELSLAIEKTQQEEDLLKFQVEEIENAQIEDINECESLEKELNVLANAEKLKELSYSSYYSLYGADESIISAMSNIKANISKLAQLDEDTANIDEAFTNTYETLKDIANNLRDYSDSKENDNQRMDEIGERLSLLEKLKRKYGGNLEEVLKTFEKLSNELNQIAVSSDELVQTEKEIKFINDELINLAQIISGARKELAKVLSQAITQELEELELPKSKFVIYIQPCEMNENGIDKVEFLISTNISEEPKSLAKTASGGEISRIMLAIKTIFAQADKTDTVIFDEIDTGISGSASQAVAESISRLSKSHQVILITHQPIIASKADSHFYVKKEQTDITKIKIYDLKDENRVKAIALLSAGEINDESTAFAKKLLGV
ncbi:DNA repair protein RecN [bacterium]|nr:DNA repair protein RecN [bacterium]